MKQAEFKPVPLTAITEDKNQPRKYFDELAMEELTGNVKKVGVLSPIMIRPDKAKAGHYFIVFGERRYRAAKSAGLKEIPAQIRDITPEEALDLQIIENLQRKDVHPMEEAIAFKSFREVQKWSTAEIGARIGKDDRYVRGRIVLCQLNADWQKAFYHHNFILVTALKIAQLSPDAQKELYKSKTAYNKFGPGDLMRFESYDFVKYSGDLNKAVFDLNDAKLVTAKGACTSCQFNSAVSSLFPGDEKAPKCTNVQCFQMKTDRNFDIKLKEAMDVPDMYFVSTRYYLDAKEKQDLKKKCGQDVMNNDLYEMVREPERPGFDDYDEDEYDSPAEMEADKEKDLKRYNTDFAEYEKKVATGKYKRAFIMHGDRPGTFAYIKIKPAKTKGSGAGSGVSSAALKAEPWLELENDIKGIREREKRTMDLDELKKWKGVKELIPAKKYSQHPQELTAIERLASARTIYDALSYEGRRVFEKEFNYKKDNHSELNITANILNRMLKFFTLDKLPPSDLYHGYNTEARICLQLADQYCKKEKDQVMEAQDIVIAKRKDRIDKRIAALQKQIKELKASVTPPKEKKPKADAAEGKAPKKTAKK